MVRAKFKVADIERTTYDRSEKQADGTWATKPVEMQTIRLVPVYSDKPGSENKKFWDATPSGEIKLGTVNAAAGNAFELGKEYYVDFIPAP